MSETLRIADQLGTDLSSRHRAAELRASLVEIVEAQGRRCEIDFAGVRSVSHSFADELFAVLVVERGESWFQANLKVINLEPWVRQTILEAIRVRCEELCLPA